MPIGHYPRPTLEERFWPRVEKLPDGQCWLWKGLTLSSGYGQIAVGSRSDGDYRAWLVHRLAYEWMVGPIPDGLSIDHLCHTRNCVNPAHLEPVTRGENNIRDGTPWRANAAIAAKRRKQTHCLRGHPLSGDNLYIPKNGLPTTNKRICKTCKAGYKTHQWD